MAELLHFNGLLLLLLLLRWCDDGPGPSRSGDERIVLSHHEGATTYAVGRSLTHRMTQASGKMPPLARCSQRTSNCEKNGCSFSSCGVATDKKASVSV